jgi:hypothetical protein
MFAKILGNSSGVSSKTVDNWGNALRALRIFFAVRGAS